MIKIVLMFVGTFVTYDETALFGIKTAKSRTGNYRDVARRVVGEDFLRKKIGKIGIKAMADANFAA